VFGVVLFAGFIAAARGETVDRRPRAEMVVTLAPVVESLVPEVEPIVVVPVGTEVTLQAMPPKSFPGFGMAEWWIDGEARPEHGNVISLGRMDARGAIHCHAVVREAPGEGGVERAVTLEVIDADCGSSLLNTSTRLWVGDDVPPTVVGFVVRPRGDGPGFSEEELVLIRVVGPGLAEFGVEQPLPDPELDLRDAKGEPVVPPYEIAVYFPWKDPKVVAEKVGAFPVDPSSGDLARVWSLKPGAYTIEVKSRSGAEGEVLVEVYDVPSAGWDADGEP